MEIHSLKSYNNVQNNNFSKQNKLQNNKPILQNQNISFGDELGCLALLMIGGVATVCAVNSCQSIQENKKNQDTIVLVKII